MTPPKEIRVTQDRRTMKLRLADGAVSELPAELLRVLSPSAEVQGHSPEQRVTVGGKRDVTIVRIEPVGNYAIRIVFDDGHATGIFTWNYLAELGAEREVRFEAYVQELKDKGLSR